MKKSKFTVTQIVSILKEANAGPRVSEVCRKHGISQPTFHNWKSKYGGMSPAELKRVKKLEAENSKLKGMYADLAMENDPLRKLIKKSSEANRTPPNSRLAWRDDNLSSETRNRERALLHLVGRRDGNC